MLGVAWILGRRENTFVAAVIPTLTDQATPGLSSGAARCRASALTARTQTLAWSVISCFAAAGYRTVSEIFPIEVRAKAITVCFAIAQGFGTLIGDGQNTTTAFFGELLGAVVMVVGGIVAAVLGVAADGKSLEQLATPLSTRVLPADPADPTTREPIRGGLSRWPGCPPYRNQSVVKASRE